MASNNTQILIYRPNVLEDWNFQTGTPWVAYEKDINGTPLVTPIPNANNEWVFAANVATYTSTGNSNYIQQKKLIQNLTYKVKLTVAGLSSGNIIASTGPSTTYSITTNGIIEFTIIAETETFKITPGTATSFNIKLVSVIQDPIVWSLDLSDDIAIPFTFSIADIKKPESRSTTYSKTATVPGTKNNNQIFGEIFEIGADTTFNPNKKTNCVILQDGLEVMNGSMQLQGIKRNGNGLNNYNGIYYEIIFLGNLSNIFYEMGNNLLTDLDYSEYSHLWNKTNIVNSWRGTIVKNGSNTTNTTYLPVGGIKYTAALNTSASGNRLQIVFTTPQTFNITDEIYLETDSSSYSQIYGYHTIYEIIDAYNIVLNYNWDSLMVSFTGVTGKCYTTTTTGEGYVYPMIDYWGANQLNAGWDLTKFYPAVYVKTYIDKIFNKTGFTYSSTFFDSAFFKRLIIPFNKPADVLTLEQDVIDSLKFKALVYSTTPVSGVKKSIVMPYSGGINRGFIWTMQVPFDNDSTLGASDPNNLWDPAVFEYTAPANIKQANFDFNISVGFRMYGNPTGYFGYSNTLCNTFTIYLQNTTTGTTIGTPFYYTSTYSSAGYSGQYYNSTTTRIINHNVSNVQNFMSPGDKAKVFIRFQEPDSYFYQSSGASIQWTGPVTVDLEIMTAACSVTSNVSTAFGEGSVMNLEHVIPKDLKQSDLFIDIIKMFNLYIMEDKTDTNKLIIEPRNSFYSDVDVIDWTDKLNIDSNISIKPMGELGGKEYIFSYKNDSDTLNSNFQTAYINSYGFEDIKIDNDFNKNINKINLNVFSPTPIAGNNNQNSAVLYPDCFNLSYAAKNNAPVNVNPRILYYGLRSCSGAKTWTMKTSGGVNNENFRIYPYAGHLDNVFGPKYDLNWTYPEMVFFDPKSWTDNNLYNAYYSKYIYEITNKNSKIISGQFRLKPSDIAQLDFRKLYYVDGHYLRLNKISDFNLTSDGLTNVEFLKAELGINIDFSQYNSQNITLGTAGLGTGLLGK
jgi:hypothetical protein